MALNGFKVFDSDLHVVEPPDLWEKYVEAEFANSVPHGLTRFSGDLGMIGPDGKPWGRQDDRGQRRAEFFASSTFAKSASRWDEFEARGWDSAAQLDAMNVEGIDAAVLYPSRGLFALAIPNMDPRLAAAIARAYNNWLHDFMEVDRSRMLGAGMISPFDIDDAIAETRRVADLGFKAVFMRSSLANGRHWHDPYYEPLWSTIEELDIALGFHESATSLLPNVGNYFSDDDFLMQHVAAHPLQQMLCTVSFCNGGILERHPSLRVAFLEGNCSWLPFLLWRMDEHVEWLGEAFTSGLTMMPSEYFKRQCYVSVESDEEPAQCLIPEGLTDRIVYSTDFPHGDSKYPNSVERFLKMPFDDDVKRAMLWDNCAEYYRVS